MVCRFRACRHYFFWGKGLSSVCRKSSCSSECLNHWASLAESLTDRGRPGEEVVCRSSVSKGQGRQPGRLPSRPVSLEINQGLVTGVALLSHLVPLPVVPCYLWDLCQHEGLALVDGLRTPRPVCSSPEPLSYLPLHDVGWRWWHWGLTGVLVGRGHERRKAELRWLQVC